MNECILCQYAQHAISFCSAGEVSISLNKHSMVACGAFDHSIPARLRLFANTYMKAATGTLAWAHHFIVGFELLFWAALLSLDPLCAIRIGWGHWSNHCAA